MALDAKSLTVESKQLFIPPLEEIAKGKFPDTPTYYLCKSLNFHFSIFLVLNDELNYNFENVTAEVVDCPDLTQQPFTLASKGKKMYIPIVLITFLFKKKLI